MKWFSLIMENLNKEQNKNSLQIYVWRIKFSGQQTFAIFFQVAREQKSLNKSCGWRQAATAQLFSSEPALPPHTDTKQTSLPCIRIRPKHMQTWEQILHEAKSQACSQNISRSLNWFWPYTLVLVPSSTNGVI